MKRVAAKRLIAFVAFLAVWELVGRSGLVSPIILAAPSDIYRALLESGGEFLDGFRVTLGEIAAAICLSWTGGLAAGLLLGSWPYGAALFGPTFSSFFAVPLVTWYPLIVIWLGIGSASKICYAAIGGFFPIALSTLNSVRNLDRHYVTFGRSIGWSQSQIVLRILLPLALPSVLSGLRIGTALAVIGVIVSEMLGSQAGLGFWITYHRTLYDTGHVYLGILLSLVCVVAVNVLLSRLERRFGAWRESQAAES
jgi:NitT/TauT family transport system permease protein